MLLEGTVRLNAADAKAPISSAEFVLSPEDDQFLDEMEKANFQFFWEQANPETGLVKDRANVRAADHTTVASIAATGFGLTALCIAQQRGWISLSDAIWRSGISPFARSARSVSPTNVAPV